MGAYTGHYLRKCNAMVSGWQHQSLLRLQAQPEAPLEVPADSTPCFSCITVGGPLTCRCRLRRNTVGCGAPPGTPATPPCPLQQWQPWWEREVSQGMAAQWSEPKQERHRCYLLLSAGMRRFWRCRQSHTAVTRQHQPHSHHPQAPGGRPRPQTACLEAFPAQPALGSTDNHCRLACAAPQPRLALQQEQSQQQQQAARRSEANVDCP
jgi:hypothetical protein